MKLFKLFMPVVAFVFLLLAKGMTYAASTDTEVVEDFTFKDIKGISHKISDYQGKWVLVNYWGTYCPPCLEEIPDLVSFAEKHKEDVVILGMDAGGTNIKDLQEFAVENMMDYVIAPVQESTLTAFGVLLGIPTTYVVTPAGEVAVRVLGIIDLDAVEELMQQYKSGGSPSLSPKETEGVLGL